MKNKILLLVLLMGIMSFSAKLLAQSYGDELAEKVHLAECMIDHINKIVDNIDQLSNSATNCTNQYEARNARSNEIYYGAVAVSVYQASRGDVFTSIATFSYATVSYMNANNTSSDAYEACGKSAISSYDLANRMADAEYDDCVKK